MNILKKLFGGQKTTEEVRETKEKGVLAFDKEDFSKKSAERFGSFKRLH